MILLLAILGILFLLSFWGGYRQIFQIKQLNRRLLTNTLITAMIALTLLSVAQGMELLSRATAAHITMGLYSVAAGFFFGYGLKLIISKRKAGPIEYMHRSFWIDIAPNLISVMLVAYGLYRTGIVTSGPFTGIGIASGLSLVGFGFFGWTIRLVPEFRSGGILILDQYIRWENVISYEWKHEGAVEIDYMGEESGIYQFTTTIPADDQLRIERLLGKKLKEYEEDRKKRMRNDGDGRTSS